MLKTVFFDFDGTIADTEPIFGTAKRQMFEELNIPTEFMTSNPGSSAYNEMCNLVKKANLNIEPKALMDGLYQRACNLAISNGIQPYEGIAKLLKFLHQNGVKMIVCTSSQRKYTVDLLCHFGIRKYFMSVICGLELPHCKPYPDVYSEALDVCSCGVDEAVAIEDTANGAVSATRAGVKCIGIRQKDAYIAEQDLSPCFTIVNKHSDIINVIKELMNK